MSTTLKKLNPEITKYRDRRFDGDQEDWDEAVVTSTTIYVGNLSFFTTEEQIYEVFSKVGDVRRIIMGLDRERRTPCGFCFVIYGTRHEAEDCVKYINATTLDDRLIRADHDWGFVEGRQFGRGRSGGQVRDEYRQDYDPGRGGFGRQVQEAVAPEWAMDASEAASEMFENGGMGDGGYPVAKHQRTHEEQRNPRFRDHASDDEGGA